MSSDLISSGLLGSSISSVFIISSCSSCSSSSEAFLRFFFSPYIGTTSRRECSIIFSSLISTLSGLNFVSNFFATFCARNLVVSGISSRCSFGMINVCPLLSGLISSIAMLFVSPSIL